MIKKLKCLITKLKNILTAWPLLSIWRGGREVRLDLTLLSLSMWRGTVLLCNAKHFVLPLQLFNNVQQ